jgi:hypothetical protein
MKARRVNNPYWGSAARGGDDKTDSNGSVSDHPFPKTRADAVPRFQNDWVRNGQRCVYVECRSMLSIQFEDATGRFGPMIGPLFLRGIYAFAEQERIANLDPSNRRAVYQ